MNFEEIVKVIDQRVSYLENKKTKIEKKLALSPKGSLYVSPDGNQIKYYKKIIGEKKRIFLSKDKEKEIRELENKAYWKKFKDTAEKELALYNKFLHSAEKIESAESTYLRIAPERRHLIVPFEFDDIEKKAKTFLSFKDGSHVTKTSLQTINGEKVRSKSELIIADRLKHHGIPYMYEPSVHLGDMDKVWLPDFYVMNKRTGETFLWEHFGMLGNENYCDSFQYKLEQYAEFGIFVGQQLIITTESTTHQLNTDHVDRLIKKYLL